MERKLFLDQLTDFAAGADVETLRQIFGPLGDYLWYRLQNYGGDVIRWYATLSSVHRATFAQAIGQQVTDRCLYIEPVCAECGQPLSSADVAAGETGCLECAPLEVGRCI